MEAVQRGSGLAHSTRSRWPGRRRPTGTGSEGGEGGEEGEGESSNSQGHSPERGAEPEASLPDAPLSPGGQSTAASTGARGWKRVRDVVAKGLTHGYSAVEEPGRDSRGSSQK